MTDQEPFLARWSARKQASRRPESAEAEPPAAPEPEAPLSEAEALEKFGLKPPEELAIGDDFKPFLRPEIPDMLRRRALRRLWRLNPAYNVVDGLVEYGEDYTDKATVVEALKTVYEVGRGFGRRLEEMAEAAEEAEEADEAQSLETPPPAAVATESVEAPAPEIAPEAPPPAPQPPAEEAAEAPVPRKRMRFTFDPS